MKQFLGDEAGTPRALRSYLDGPGESWKEKNGNDPSCTPKLWPNVSGSGWASMPLIFLDIPFGGSRSPLVWSLDGDLEFGHPASMLDGTESDMCWVTKTSKLEWKVFMEFWVESLPVCPQKCYWWLVSEDPSQDLRSLASPTKNWRQIA
jgi:hypothetical protein